LVRVNDVKTLKGARIMTNPATPTPQPESTNAFADSAGLTAKTESGKPPVPGEQVKLTNPDGQEKQGHWDGENFIEDEAAK
jgi:hypothetical protein